MPKQTKQELDLYRLYAVDEAFFILSYTEIWLHVKVNEFWFSI
ncbi:hypothetical protein [Mariniflexile sp. HMF6888]